MIGCVYGIIELCLFFVSGIVVFIMVVFVIDLKLLIKILQVMFIGGFVECNKNIVIDIEVIL